MFVNTSWYFTTPDPPAPALHIYGAVTYPCSNDRCLAIAEHYGFVLESNPHDAALLPVEALPHSQLREAVQQRDCWLHPCGVPSWTLLEALRIWAAAQCGQW